VAERFYVSSDLRDAFIEESGATGDALKLLFYLVTPFRDDESEQPVLAYDLIRNLVGTRSNGGLVKGLVGQLAAQTGMAIECSGYSRDAGKARTVTRLEWPDRLGSLKDRMLADGSPLEKRVDLFTGRRYSRNEVTAYSGLLRDRQSQSGNNRVATDLLQALGSVARLDN
jgi:hypothetical protein